MVEVLYVMRPDLFDADYTPPTRTEIQSRIDINDEVTDLGKVATNDQVEVLRGGWGMIELTVDILNQLPNLKVIFYAAGTMKDIVTEDVWHYGKV